MEIRDLCYIPTPIQEIEHPALLESSIRLFVKREDLNHPFVTGNKWWKLRYNLREAQQQRHETLLTFGGAYSNHIYAVAAAAKELGLKSIGVIRGEEHLPLNARLKSAVSNGMTLHYVTRLAYRNKNNDTFLTELNEQFDRFYLIPEGGSNERGVKGVEELGKLLPWDFDYLCCPVGTGASMAGLIRASMEKSILLGFVVMKGGESWKEEVNKYSPVYGNWDLQYEYHFGGYAKSNSILNRFINDFQESYGIALDPVYSAKMFFGIFDLVRKKFFKKNSRIMAIHTGGIIPGDRFQPG